MTAPISPNEARERALDSIPPFVIEAFNELLAEKASTTALSLRIRITRSEAVERIKTKLPYGSVLNTWLDVEPIYRGCGWDVSYDSPSYGDSYEAYYIFTSPRKDWTGR